MSIIKDLHVANGAETVQRNGVAVPLSYGDVAAAHQALRKNVLLADYSHFGMVEVSGDEAFEFLDETLAGDLGAVRDEQALYTLLLDNDGEIVTDMYVLCDDERYLLLTEWDSGPGLASMLRDLKGEHDAEIQAIDQNYACFLLEGPYCWELAAELFGMDVIGLPFLEFMHVDNGILFRSGKHGEYGYKILVEPGAAAELWGQLVELGEKFDLQIGGLDFQELARLENPCWNPVISGEFSRCPVELQMQWALRYDKDAFIGKDAVLAKLEQGVSRRLVGIVLQGDTAEPAKAGDTVFCNDEAIGKLLSAGYSPERKAQIGQALLDIDFAYADINLYQVECAGERVPASTSAVPFIQNFSFAVSPSEHSYVDPSRPKSIVEQAAEMQAS